MEYTLPVMKIVAQESKLNKIHGKFTKIPQPFNDLFEPQNQCDGSGARSVQIITDLEGPKTYGSYGSGN